VDTNDCLRMARGFGAHAALNKPFNREQFEAGVALALGPLPDPAAW
jgi:hypothetical protein